jgi:trimethylamine:corrinoid methyltransferase-like protein
MTRRSRRTKRAVDEIRQLPWCAVVNPYTPVEILDAGQIETLVQAALTILHTQGMRFLDTDSRRILREAGADVDEANLMVCFDAGLIKEK